ncbi:hypothetical protein HYFRA_00003751 [Hymenoscyphus fraxineus]|uniref:Tat pathway signal sequence protein n=1 Tax=Hymenoscyphus fraxineus TaxID=746836 RepID=A0A9N9KYV3_9HELO|nr:hypothetical protein HYFRA_00003751 [Hymenoscyphus fraxineus]
MESTKYTSLSRDEEDTSFKSPLRQHIFRIRRFPYQPWIFAILVISNLCFANLWLREKQSEKCIRPKLTYSPAKDSIRYEKRRLTRNITSNVYTGDPRPEFDEAWRKLIEPITIKISDQELEILNETSVALKSGGYIAETAVYHELHCVKRIRRHLHLDHYYPHMTEDEKRREGPHIDHCLEYWREAAMCRGDTTLATFRWADGKPYSTVYSDHECVDWDMLDSWARGRMVDMSDYSILDLDKL